MLQSVLQQLDLTTGLVLLVSSPGGDGVAAERIVKVCRSYSGTGDFWAIVPGKAKSAGTMICMGAAKIYMAPSSELGPVDPQIIKIEDSEPKFFSAHSLVSGYDKLFDEAVNTQGHLEPYIQQLNYYDVREINKWRTLINLSESISIRLLSSGMMDGKTDDQIKAKIKVFLEPEAGTVTHGRPIYAPEAKNCDLNIEDLDVVSNMWRAIYELYVRTDRYVSQEAAKAVESKGEAFFVSLPGGM